MTAKTNFFRRQFLYGAGGVTLGLPLLETFLPRQAFGATAKPAPFVAIVVNGNGVVQAGADIKGGTDPEKFWPSKTGSLTKASMLADVADRATGELSDHAARLLMVRGVNQTMTQTGCMHASSDAHALTATQPVGSGNTAQASGPSVDTLIAKALDPAGRDPLTLHAGLYSPGGKGFNIPGYISYIASQQPRTPDASPYQAYQRMIGLTNVDSTQSALITKRRTSVNDVLRSQIQALLARTDLSSSDRIRLQAHFDAVRTLEVSFTGGALADTEITAMKAVDATPYDNKNHITLIKLHMDLMVFALSSGYTHASTLKIGDREDDQVFVVNGSTWDTFHSMSHRTGTDPLNRCIQIDHMHAQYFKYFLDQLAAVQTPTGTLLDQGIAILSNQVGNGAHSPKNIPWVLAGSAGGVLKQGQFLDLGPTGASTNQMLQTLLSAAGVVKADGSPADIGTATNKKGVISAMIA